MKILVTGSRGIIGSRISEFLKLEGHGVYGIDLQHDLGEIGWTHKLRGGTDDYSRCDIGDYRQLQRVIEHFRPDLIYNCAAEFGRWNGEDFYEQLWQTNVIGLKNIIRLQEKYEFQLVHFSSSEVYGDYTGVMEESVMDTVPIKQMNDYAMTKWVNEMQIRNSIIEHQTDTVIVRLFNTYGPGETYHPYRSVNSRFCFSALNGEKITVYRGHLRTSTYIDDACRALVAIAGNFHPGEVYNIGGGEYHSIERLAEIIWKYTGASESFITYKDSEILTTKIKKVDNTKAKRDLGFEATVSLEEGVKKTIDWMQHE